MRTVLNPTCAADAMANIEQIHAKRILIQGEGVRLAIATLLRPPKRESSTPMTLAGYPRWRTRDRFGQLCKQSCSFCAS